MATRDFTFNWFLEQIVLEQNRTEKNTELGSERWTGTGSGSSNEQITQLYKFQHKFPIPTEKGSPKNPSHKFLNFKNSQPIISTEKKWKWVIKNSTATLTQPGRFPKCSQTLFALHLGPVRGWCRIGPHFTKEEMTPQRGDITCPQSWVRSVGGPSICHLTLL